MIDSINFRLLNIDKYLTEIVGLYYNFNNIRELPFYERLLNGLLVKEYERHTRRLVKNITKPLQTYLTASELNNKQYYESEINQLKDTINKVAYLDCFTTLKPNKAKKYFYFDITELENFYIPACNDIVTQINGVLPLINNETINEIESNFSTSPLPKIDFYKTKLKELKAKDFIYLDDVLSGKIIQGLDNQKVLTAFTFELDTIKTIQYLETKIFELENPTAETSETSTNKLTQKQIVLLFQCLAEIGVFQKNKINQDNTKQAKLIALITGIEINNKPDNWNFYKYWNSVQSINDTKQIITKPNLEMLLSLSKIIDFKPLTDNLQDKIKEL